MKNPTRKTYKLVINEMNKENKIPWPLGRPFSKEGIVKLVISGDY